MGATAALTAAFLLCGAPPAPAQTPAPGQASERDRAAELGLALRRLGTGERVLMIAAHPDDENTSLIAALALGRGADVGYLSLTRGEGGQNGIGPELGEALGLLRSEELLAARRLDGAVQRFTRAYDYGYSKSAEEAFRHWPRDSLLADVVAVVRSFRPDVVVAVFSGTPRDGHGQHEASGILAREAFRAAGDAARFPELGPPHQPAVLYQALWRSSGGADASVATGTLDPLLGRSWHQVAMASRSLHRSQDMGQEQEPGPRAVAVQVVERAIEGSGPAGGEADADALFRGIPTTLRERAGTAAADALARYEDAVATARGAASLLDPGAAAPALAEALGALREAETALRTLGTDGAKRLLFHLRDERRDAEAALTLASGIVFEAVASDDRIVPGQELGLELRLWNGGELPVEVREIAPRLPEGWSATAEAPAPAMVAPGELVTRSFRVRVASGADPSQPYFLEAPRAGDLYRWPDDPALRGLPFEPDLVRASAELSVAGASLGLEAAAVRLVVDKTMGEQRLPLLVVPAVSVLLDPGTAVLPLAPATRANGDGGATPAVIAFRVRLRGGAPDGVDGVLRLETPAGWRAEPAFVPLRLGEEEERAVDVRVFPPDDVAPGAYAIAAVFEAESGTSYRRGYTLVDYPHVRPRPLFRAAEAAVRAFEVAVPRDVAVGYIMGAGDDGPAALGQLGIPVEMLGPGDLMGDLSRFDVIVAGIRAWEFRPDLVAANDRLLEWVKAGGTLIANYNKYEYDAGDFAPYALDMDRPHDRVTDEGAPVSFAEPDHPVLNAPNRIGPADFEGWVQERGLYFADAWDARWQAPLAMADPGEESQRGALLIAPYGEGTYVYTGLAFFRQLPEGVPGAYRLLANLVALGSR